MQSNHLNKEGLARTTTHLLNSIVTDLQQLTKAVKGSSKAAAETNAGLVNRMLLAGKDELVDLLRELLTHLLHVVDLKTINTLIVSILSKVISLIKIFFSEDEKLEKLQQKSRLDRQMEALMQAIVDILFVLVTRHKDGEMPLRIIQTIYSLIEPALLRYAEYHLITRIYSICFTSCLVTPSICSISASAIFSITEIIFSSDFNSDLAKILRELLQLLLKGKKSQWAKDLQLKAIVWDVTLIAVRNIPEKDIEQVLKDGMLVELLNSMYQIAMNNSFSKDKNLIEHDVFKGSIQLDVQRSRNQDPKKELLRDYIKYYKVFVYFSIHLSLKLKEGSEIVPFRKHMNRYHSLYDFPRSTRFYVLLEGIVLIVSYAQRVILQEEGGIMLVDIFQKVCEELYASKVPFQVVWEGSELLINKMFADYSRIADQDYLRLTKNMLVNLRKSFENGQTHRLQEALEDSGDASTSELGKQEQKQDGLAYRWRRLIKSVIRIIRYLTSLNFKENSNDQAIRRFLMELQYWYAICPTTKARNTILLELQHLTNNIEDQNQAIKASQCMQICANILYGFYATLNSTAVSIVFRILANIKVSCEIGRDFNELDEVSQMTDRFYIEEKLIATQDQFHVTVEGIILCLNLLVADLQVPLKSQQPGKDARELTEKYLKLIDYVFYKLRLVMEINSEFVKKQWDLIRCFWVSMCSNKQAGVRGQMMAHIEIVFRVLLKNSMISEIEVVDTYIQLSKLEIEQISKQVLQQLKDLLAYLRNQQALVSLMRVLEELQTKRYADKIRNNLTELEDMIIKESLFNIKSESCLLAVVDSLDFRGKSKNEEYGTINLLWTIADHVKALYQEGQQVTQLFWSRILGKLIQFARITDHPGTRQSCIHTFTQILADCKIVIGEKLFYKFITEEYLVIFLLLMGYEETVPKLDDMVQVEMAKIAIKNFIKLARKCLGEGAQHVSCLLQSSVIKTAESMEKIGSKFPIEYFIELCQFLQFLKEVVGIKGEVEEQKLISIEEVNRIFGAMEGHHQEFDQTSFIWRKKYLPHFTELKEFFAA